MSSKSPSENVELIALLKKARDIVLLTAKEAGDILKSKWGANNTFAIEFKGEINLVTEMDKKAEDIIIARLSEAFPTFSFLCEESGTTPSKVDSSNEVYKGRWIIDPLDGTTSYAHGYPTFSVSIALEFQGLGIVIGCVYQPVLNEMFFAMKGEGATINGIPIHVSKTEQLIKSLVATGFPYDRRTCPPLETNIPYFNNLVMKVRDIRRDGSAAVDMCYVACGRVDAYWEWKLSPWDIAAGSLIVEEAGGTVTDFYLKPLNMNDIKIQVLASNGKLHSSLISSLREVDNK